MHLQNKTAGFHCVHVEASYSEEEYQRESLYSLMQNTPGHTYNVASSAGLVLAEQFGYAIKAYKLIAQQNNNPSLIPA